MAVYFNLSVDCDQNELLAVRLCKSFDGFTISSDRFGAMVCESEHTLPNFYWGNRGAPKECAGDWHKVCVHPNGMSMSQKMPGILDAENMNFVQRELYRFLRSEIQVESGIGFRSAWFGWEAQDTLGDSDWLERISEMNTSGTLPVEMHGLILNEKVISNPAVRNQLEEFSPGYLWWNAPLAGY